VASWSPGQHMLMPAVWLPVYAASIPPSHGLAPSRRCAAPAKGPKAHCTRTEPLSARRRTGLCKSAPCCPGLMASPVEGLEHDDAPPTGRLLDRECPFRPEPLLAQLRWVQEGRCANLRACLPVSRRRTPVRASRLPACAGSLAGPITSGRTLSCKAALGRQRSEAGRAVSRNCEPQRLSGSDDTVFFDSLLSQCLPSYVGPRLDHTALLELCGTLRAQLHRPHLRAKRVRRSIPRSQTHGKAEIEDRIQSRDAWGLG